MIMHGGDHVVMVVQFKLSAYLELFKLSVNTPCLFNPVSAKQHP